MSNNIPSNKQENLWDALINSFELLSKWKCRGFSCSDESIATLESWNLSSKKAWATATPIAGPTPPPESMDNLQSEAVGCNRCSLCKDRKHVLFGHGDVNARLFIIGAMPNPEEDRTGKLLSDQSGALLVKIIGAMNLTPDQIYVTNIVKCRPKNGRLPTTEEIHACQTYWQRQIQLIKPEVICCLGERATHVLLDEDEPIDELRGKFFSKFHCRVMPTLAPEYLIENPDAKRLVWEDVKKMMAYLGIPR